MIQWILELNMFQGYHVVGWDTMFYGIYVQMFQRNCCLHFVPWRRTPFFWGMMLHRWVGIPEFLEHRNSFIFKGLDTSQISRSLNMKGLWSFKTPETTHPVWLHHICEGLTPEPCSCEYLKTSPVPSICRQQASLKRVFHNRCSKKIKSDSFLELSGVNK
jgi:hypothetical protein